MSNCAPSSFSLAFAPHKGTAQRKNEHLLLGNARTSRASSTFGFGDFGREGGGAVGETDAPLTSRHLTSLRLTSAPCFAHLRRVSLLVMSRRKCVSCSVELRVSGVRPQGYQLGTYEQKQLEPFYEHQPRQGTSPFAGVWGAAAAPASRTVSLPTGRGARPSGGFEKYCAQSRTPGAWWGEWCRVQGHKSSPSCAMSFA